jgi:hypothetical protein
MMHTIFQRVALAMLVHCVRTESICEAYWDLMYVYKFGLPQIPLPAELDILRWWNKPRPDPPPIDYPGIEVLFLDVVGVALGDPNPQPNVLREIYGNTAVRLDSVKRLSVFYENTLTQLNLERERLEQLR